MNPGATADDVRQLLNLVVGAAGHVPALELAAL